MRLMKLSQFRRLAYAPGSAPCLNTLRAQINSIPGGKVLHGHYWVDMDEFERRTSLLAGVVARQEQLASHPLLDGLL